MAYRWVIYLQSSEACTCPQREVGSLSGRERRANCPCLVLRLPTPAFASQSEGLGKAREEFTVSPRDGERTGATYWMKATGWGSRRQKDMGLWGFGARKAEGGQGLGASTSRTLGDSGGRTLKSCLDTLQENATCLPGRRTYYSDE